jgi:UDP-3-O-acyl N-acetylglucosamine deacetylase
MGALDYLEKPLSYGQAVEAVNGGLRYRRSAAADEGLLLPIEHGADRLETDHRLEPPPTFALVRESSLPQRTIGQATVLYGLGLHSGRRTGMSLQPLPPGTGIHFVTLPTGTRIPAHVAAVGETTYATTLEGGDGVRISTVEHLLSALHAAGITNLLIKVHGEIPVLDGSALEFCQTLEEVGIENQPAPRREVVVDRAYEVTGEEGKSLRVEPYDGFAVSYLLRYPPPVGEQHYEYELSDFAAYKQEIAPARTFGFLKDVQMMNELGLGSGGRIDNCILVGEDEVINTELRFPDEFVRHKILDIIGDLYLLGYPLRGRVTAKLSGHRFNIDLLRRILAESGASAAVG